MMQAKEEASDRLSEFESIGWEFRQYRLYPREGWTEWERLVPMFGKSVAELITDFRRYNESGHRYEAREVFTRIGKEECEEAN